MADSFVLRNGGDFVLRNGGDKILRNQIVVVEDVPERSISHVTLDAGVDLRKHKRSRQTQILKLSTEIPITGTVIKKQKLVLTLEGMCKRTETLSIPSLLILSHTIKTPISGTLLKKQKSLFEVTGLKAYSKEAIRATATRKKLAKIDTLKELLRQLNEE